MSKSVWDKPFYGTQNAKTVKGESLGYMTLILYLAPAQQADGTFNVCPEASEGCKASCLYTAGRGVYAPVQEARIAKTLAYKEDRQRFIAKCSEEIRAAEWKARKLGMKLSVRNNGTSDLIYLDWKLATMHPHIQFYAYTKIPSFMDVARRKLPNIHLTYSRSEHLHTESEAKHLLRQGQNVAVVFDTEKGEPLPATWKRFRVIDGDEHDLRFLDPKGVVVGLRAKGRAKLDTTGFVVRFK